MNMANHNFDNQQGEANGLFFTESEWRQKSGTNSVFHFAPEEIEDIDILCKVLCAAVHW